MGRYMAELGITPSARSRVATRAMPDGEDDRRIVRVIIDRLADRGAAPADAIDGTATESGDHVASRSLKH